MAAGHGSGCFIGSEHGQPDTRRLVGAGTRGALRTPPPTPGDLRGHLGLLTLGGGVNPPNTDQARSATGGGGRRHLEAATRT